MQFFLSVAATHAREKGRVCGGRRAGGRGVHAAVWQLMLSAGGDFTAEFGRPPMCPAEHCSGMFYRRNMQHDENSVNRSVV